MPRNFTEQELKDLLAFYKSPLGKKSLEQEPKSIEASLNYMRNWGEDLARGSQRAVSRRNEEARQGSLIAPDKRG